MPNANSHGEGYFWNFQLREIKAAAFLGAAIVLAGTAGAADPDVDAGRAKFVLCASCHGGDGRSGALPEYPKIAGQNQKYLVNALKAYKSGRRVGTYAALMAATADTLSDADIENLAAYLAGLDDSK
jgi:cytochrome c553